MKRREEDLVQRCVKRLRELPFVDEAVLREEANRHQQVKDGILQIVTPNGTEEFIVEAKRTHLTRAIIDGVIAHRAQYGPRPWILFAPHVGRPLAKYLAEQGINFVDLAGNCRLRIDRRHFAMIEGRPLERRPTRGRGIGAPGGQVLFAILVRPDLLNAPVRTLAEAADVAPATAADRVAQLRKEGLVHEVDPEKRLAEPQRILDLWLKTYGTLVRPKLLIGRYRTRDGDPEGLEHRIEDTFGEEVTWAWGGGAAAQRLTGYYRGPDTVVHLQEPDFDVPRRLRALGADDGPLILMRAPAPIAFEGVQPRTVNPLLVYTELLFTGDKRACEAAEEIRKKFLAHIP